ncbi:hypothetical protein YTPLAS18_18760 [Nitrospira sp.]|nr:hypothetical protein YTPLAS18_18760 [Nitrospira sp.]
MIFAVDPVTRPTTKAVTLAWDPNPETDIAGYKVYVGTKSGRYGPPISLGNVTTYTFANLEPGSTYYFVVTAYDKSGNESSPSSEVSTTLE